MHTNKLWYVKKKKTTYFLSRSIYWYVHLVDFVFSTDHMNSNNMLAQLLTSDVSRHTKKSQVNFPKVDDCS